MDIDVEPSTPKTPRKTREDAFSMEQPLFMLGRDLVLKIIDFLDARSQAALFATCITLRSQRKAGIAWYNELNAFLEQNPPGQNKQAPFGNAGVFEVLSYVPSYVLRDAFAAALKKCPADELALQTLLQRYVLPVDALMNSHELTTIFPDHKRDLGLALQWRPLPCAVYIVVCILDWYCEENLPKNQKKVKVADRYFTPLNPDRVEGMIANRIDDLHSLMQGDSAARALDSVLWEAMSKLKPGYNVTNSVRVLEKLVEEYNVSYLNDGGGETMTTIIEHMGFFGSKIDGRVHWIPASTIKERVKETKEFKWPRKTSMKKSSSKKAKTVNESSFFAKVAAAFEDGTLGSLTDFHPIFRRLMFGASLLAK